MKLITNIVGITTLLFLFGCSSEVQDWQTANLDNTSSAYGAFLEKYPDGEHAASARAKIEGLAWAAAQSTNSIIGYQAYLEQYAEGEFGLEAKGLIENLRFADAETEGTVEAFEAFLADHPEGKNSLVARQSIEGIFLRDAEATNTITGYQDFLKLYAQGSSADRARELLDKIYPSITAETALAIKGISALVGDGSIVFSAGKEPETLVMYIPSNKVPVESGMTCSLCARTVEMAPNLKISTTLFEAEKHHNPSPYVASHVEFKNMTFVGPLKKNQPFYIVSGPEGATLRKEGSAFRLVSGQANLLRGNGAE